MTESASPVTAELIRYMADHTLLEDRFLRSLRRAAAEAGIPSIAIAPEQGSLMQVLLRLRAARDVVEVGTLYGLAAIWMARALPAEGRVRTIEISEKHADFAEAWIEKSDVADRVEVLRGAGQEVLPTLADASADAIFLDSDKSGYPLYLEESVRILRPGGLLMVDNAFAFGELLDPASTRDDVRAMREFNERLARDTRFQSAMIAVGDGLWVAVKS